MARLPPQRRPRARRRAASPARQVAPVAVALALGAGRAPRLVLALEPAELGRVEIRIQRPADRSVAAVQVLAERPETLALLRQDAQGLDRALQQAGLPAAERTLSFALAQDHGGDGQGGSQGGDQGRPDRPPHRPPGHGSAYPTAVPSPGEAHARSARSIIDLAI